MKDREQKILDNLNLVRKIAKGYWINLNKKVEYEDLFQVGCVGLIKAVDLYDKSKGVKFSTFAYSYIHGEIKHFIRDKVFLVKIPRWIKEIYKDVLFKIEEFKNKNGREPTLDELSKLTNIKKEGIKEILKAISNFELVDLSKIQNVYINSFSVPIEEKVALFSAIQDLPEIEKNIIYLFFSMIFHNLRLQSYLI